MSSRAWALFLAVYLLWGIPYLLIKVAVDEVSPAVVVFARTALAAAVLLPIAWRLGALRGLGRRPRDLVVLALTSVAIPFTRITAGELWVSSSLTAILIAAERWRSRCRQCASTQRRGSTEGACSASGSAASGSWRCSASTSPGAVWRCWAR